MSINGLHRREYENPVATIQIDENAEIYNLVINDISAENHTDCEMPLFVHNGNVKRLIKNEAE